MSLIIQECIAAVVSTKSAAAASAPYQGAVLYPIPHSWVADRGSCWLRIQGLGGGRRFFFAVLTLPACAL